MGPDRKKGETKMNVKEKLLAAFDSDIAAAEAAGNKYAVNDLRIVRSLIERTAEAASQKEFMEAVKATWTPTEKTAYQQAVAYKQGKR